MLKANKAMMPILSLPQNNQSLLCTETNGLKKLISPSDTEVFPHASEKRQAPMVRITGASSESINSKKLNNLLSANLNNLGSFMRK